MRITIFPKHALEAKWCEDALLYKDDEAVYPPLCLRCGKPLSRNLAENALSRYIDAYICSRCGNDEGMRDYTGDRLPLSEWYAVKHGIVKKSTDMENAVLVDTCSFKPVFDQPRRPTPLNSLGYPESQLCFFRSDHNSSQWHTQWFDCREKPHDQTLLNEVDAFQLGLFELTEFIDLYSMSDLCCKCAERTSDRTEFNLYSETEHFHIWLRLITRSMDYNIYVYFFEKLYSEA
ncbi:MAG: hypothetical protein E7211_21720 [Clostridium lundense]|nr:hypothetical protein [Clostridium lundense]